MTKRSPSEISWGWDLISVVLLWKLAPNGVTLLRKDLGGLPRDRVLVEDRASERITFTWMTLEAAHALESDKAASGEKVGVNELQGRWHKLACVLMWKLRKDLITVLTPQDRANVPGNLILYTQGSKHEVLFRFMPREEAERLRRWHDFNEGLSILEKPH